MSKIVNIVGGLVLLAATIFGVTKIVKSINKKKVITPEYDDRIENDDIDFTNQR